MLPYLIAGAIGFGIAKLFEEGGETFGRGGMTNGDILRSFLTSNRETQTNNLSTHYNQYDDFLLLRNYSTLIATRKGNNVKITNQKYSKTTSTITNRLKALAEEMGYNVSYVSKFEGGGELEAIHLQATNLDKKGAESLSEILKKYNKYVRIEKGEDGLYKVYTSSIGGEDKYAGGGSVQGIDLENYSDYDEFYDVIFEYVKKEEDLSEEETKDILISNESIIEAEFDSGSSPRFTADVILGYLSNERNYAGGGKAGKKSFADVYDEVVKYIMTDQNVSYDEAVAIIDEENGETFIRDMVEFHGNYDAELIAENILSTDEGKYYAGGGGVGKYKVLDNQYIPYKSNRAVTYYYVSDENNNIINKKTGKIYRGKQMDNYMFKNKEEAQSYANKLNGKMEEGVGEPKKRRRRANAQIGKTDRSVDKTRVAKPVGYRFTNALASKLRKDKYEVPTEKQITKYLGKGIYKENRRNKSDRDLTAKL